MSENSRLAPHKKCLVAKSIEKRRDLQEILPVDCSELSSCIIFFIAFPEPPHLIYVMFWCKGGFRHFQQFEVL